MTSWFMDRSDNHFFSKLANQEPLTFLEAWQIMVAVATSVSLGGELASDGGLKTAACAPVLTIGTTRGSKPKLGATKSPFPLLSGIL
jgi:hypothetical protein